MTQPTNSKASGFQIAFLIFAVALLAVPAQKYLGPLLGLDGGGKFVSRLFLFVPTIALLALVPAFREFCREQLRTRPAPGTRMETAVVAAGQVALPFAIGGAIVLWHWTLGGEMALARRLGQQRSVEVDLAEALTLNGMLFSLVLAGVIAPVVEELLFRGLLYRAWEAQWGWFPSALATSAVFGAYHPVPFAAFVGSLIFIAVMRRTGSIWSAIVVHAAGNIALWPPLLGQFYFRTAGRETGEVGLWPFHLAALALLAIALPVYLWMGRAPSEHPEITEDAAASRC